MALSPADTDIVRRDPQVPGIATVLDPEAFAAALEKKLPNVELEFVKPTYVRYKPETSCLVSYALRSSGGVTARVYAKAHGPDAGIKLRKAREKPASAGPFGAGRLVLEEAGVVVSFFPNDGRLRALRRLAEDSGTCKLLKDLLPDLPRLYGGDLQTLRYKPERRYVACLVSEGRPVATVKFYAEPDYRAVKSATEAFTGLPDVSGALRLPRLLGCSGRFHAVAFEWENGVALREASPEAGEATGVALARLHAGVLGGNSGGLEYVTRQEEANELLAVASAVGFTCPRLSRTAHDVASGLSARLLDQTPEYRLTHGDFYDEQVLVDGERVSILDLDRATLRDPAWDIGNFAAHLERAALLGPLSRDRAEALKARLFVGYRSAAALPDPGRIRLYTAIGLLKLAPEPFRRREPDWPGRTRRILERAREFLPGAALAS